MADTNTETQVPAPIPVPMTEVLEVTTTPVAATPAAEAPAPEPEVEDVEPPTPPAHTFLLKDIGDAIDRVKRSNLGVPVVVEFADNLYPMLQAIIDHFGERADKAEAALTEIIEQTDSFVQEDLAMLVANALNLGKAMATIIGQFKPGMVLDAKGVGKMKGLAAQYLNAADLAATAVAEVTIEGDDEEGDDEEGDDEEDGGEEEVRK